MGAEASTGLCCVNGSKRCRPCGDTHEVSRDPETVVDRVSRDREVVVNGLFGHDEAWSSPQAPTYGSDASLLGVAEDEVAMVARMNAVMKNDMINGTSKGFIHLDEDLGPGREQTALSGFENGSAQDDNVSEDLRQVSPYGSGFSGDTPDGGISFTFRFFNYNMANRTDLSLEDTGSGFLSLRKRSSSRPSGSSRKSLVKGLANMGRRKQVFSSPVHLLMLMTEGLEQSTHPASDSGEIRRVSSTSAESTALSHSPPRIICERRDNPGFSTKLSVSEEVMEPKLSSPKFSRRESNGTTRSMGSMMTAMSTAMTTRSVRTKTQNLFPRYRPNDLDLETSVDCAFGTFCETRFPLEEYATGLIMQGGAHVHCRSAGQCLQTTGHIRSMKGKISEKYSGDLKTFAVCRGTLREVEDGRIYCSFEESAQGVSKGNPMKSFLGQTFAGVAQDDREIRFVMLGTHFPMHKVASLMQNETLKEEEILNAMKCHVAKLLQKILCDLLHRNVLDATTMVILSGDLNSRSVVFENAYVDLVRETLEDPLLQEFISADVPPDIRGQWREVVEYTDWTDLPATYRFAQDKTSISSETKLLMRHIYGQSVEDTAGGYRQVSERLKSSGIIKDWGLYNPDLKGDKVKFKPSRLPACTERVIYYTPDGMTQRCRWDSQEGYEVNYLHTGSDHKPMLLEATLTIYKQPVPDWVEPERNLNDRRSQRQSRVPVDFEDRFISQGADSDSDDSGDSREPPKELQKEPQKECQKKAARSFPSMISFGSRSTKGSERLKTSAAT